MDPFDFLIRRPVPVKASTTASDLDFDENLIDRILGTPEKIDIPERYIPEEEPQLEPEEERKRSQKAEAICRLLSKSNGAAGMGIPLNPVRVVAANPKTNTLSFHQQDSLDPALDRGNCSSYPRDRTCQLNSQHSQIYFTVSGGDATKKAPVRGIVHSSPASPVKRATSLRKPGSIPSFNSLGGSVGSGGEISRHSGSQQTCDWSLAGIRAPKEVRTSNLSATERLFGNKRPPPPSVYGFGKSPSSCHRSEGSNTGSSQNYATLSNLTSSRRLANNSGNSCQRNSSDIHTRSSIQPSHSYNSSYSSSCSSGGRSSADREELLHLQQYLAKEVTEKSRLVAVRALASSPAPKHDFSHPRYRDPSPPSPVELPIVQQREGFFT